jgi:hypothetical protein
MLWCLQRKEPCCWQVQVLQPVYDDFFYSDKECGSSEIMNTIVISADKPQYGKMSDKAEAIENS